MVTDNMAYLVETEEGESHLPKRDDGGIYHVDGQVKLASAKQIRRILQKFLPLLQLLKKNKKIILVPLPRYVCQPCCLAADHCTNRKDQDFLPSLLGGLKEVRRELKEACHGGVGVLSLGQHDGEGRRPPHWRGFCQAGQRRAKRG